MNNGVLIEYSVNGCEPRTIEVPSVAEARAINYRDQGDRLAKYVLDHGQLQGAVEYCTNCFTSHSTTKLVLKDGCGNLRRFI